MIPASVVDVSVWMLDKTISFQGIPLTLSVDMLNAPNELHLPLITHLGNHHDYTPKMTSLKTISIGQSEEYTPIGGVEFVKVPDVCRHIMDATKIKGNSWEMTSCRYCHKALEVSSTYGTFCNPVPACESMILTWWYNVEEVKAVLAAVKFRVGVLYIRATAGGMNEFFNKGCFDLIPSTVEKVELFINSTKFGDSFVGVKKIYPFEISVNCGHGGPFQIEDYTGINECSRVVFSSIDEREKVVRNNPRLSIVY